ncbi:MAG: anthranilate phosphoribosyltransferase, partial [Jatrophihabitans sp.]
SRVWLVVDGQVRAELLDPAEVGISPAEPSALVGGDARFNADVVRHVLTGAAGPVREAVLLNAAGAIAAFDGRLDSARSAIEYGLPIAAAAIDDGSAATLLRAWVELSQQLKAG